MLNFGNYFKIKIGHFLELVNTADIAQTLFFFRFIKDRTLQFEFMKEKNLKNNFLFFNIG